MINDCAEKIVVFIHVDFLMRILIKQTFKKLG